MLMPAVWAMDESTKASETITNDLHGSHAPTTPAVASNNSSNGEGVKGNLTSAAEKGILEELSTLSPSSDATSTSSSSSTSTSTATPTTTATTSTTTTTATTTTTTRTTAVAVATGNEAGVEIMTTTAAVENRDDDVATTKTALDNDDDDEANDDVAATTLADKLMTTNVPALASLGNIFDRLYRIKLSEADSNLDSSADFEEVPIASSTPSPLHIQMQAAASYQVAETLADLNEEERKRYGALLFQQSSASKLNIVDLYPMKIEDYQPVMKEEKAEEQEQHAVFKQLDNAEEYRQNLMPNEVEMLVVNPTVNQPTTTTTPSA